MNVDVRVDEPVSVCRLDDALFLKIGPARGLQNSQTTAVLTQLSEELFEVGVRVHNGGESVVIDVVVCVPLPDGLVLSDGSGDACVYFMFDAIQPAHTAARSTELVLVSSLRSNIIVLSGVRVVCNGAAQFVLPASTTELRTTRWFGDEASGLSVDESSEVEAGERVIVRLRARNVSKGPVDDITARIIFPESLRYAAGSVRLNGIALSERVAKGARRSRRASDRRGRIEDGPPEAAIRRFAPGDTIELEAHAYAVPCRDGEETAIRGEFTWGVDGSKRFEVPLQLCAQPAFLPEHNRIDVVGPAEGVAGDVVRFSLQVMNAGAAGAVDVRIAFDTSAFGSIEWEAESRDHVRFDAETQVASIGTVLPRDFRVYQLRASIPADIENRSVLHLAARLFSGEKELGALTPAEIVVRTTPFIRAEDCTLEIVEGEPLRPGCSARVRIRVQNGSCVARNVRAVCAMPPELQLQATESTIVLGDIAPHGTGTGIGSITLAVPTRGILAVRAAIHADDMFPTPLEPLWIRAIAKPDFSSASLSTDPARAVRIGEMLTVLLHAKNTGDGVAKRLTLHAEQPDGTAYMCGSTTINGFTVVDAADCSALHKVGGLVFEDVMPGAEVLVRWSSYVCGPRRDLTQRVRLSWDENENVGVQGAPVAIEADANEADLASELPFRVGAAFRTIADVCALAIPATVIGPPSIELPSVEACGEVYLEVAITRTERDEMVAYLREVDYDALVTHVLTLRALFPSHITTTDARVEAAFNAARDAVRSVLDRLYIKLRIPGYDVMPRDLEDAKLREALIEFMHSLCEGRTLMHRKADGMRVNIDSSDLQLAVSALESSPRGSHKTILALAALVPTESIAHAETAISFFAYRAALREILVRFDDLPPGAFHRSLREPAPEGLDAARGELLNALMTSP